MPISGTFLEEATFTASGVTDLSFRFELTGPSFSFFGGQAETGAFVLRSDPTLPATFGHLTMDPNFPAIGARGTFSAEVPVILEFANMNWSGGPFLGVEHVEGSFVMIPETTTATSLGALLCGLLSVAALRRRRLRPAGRA